MEDKNITVKWVVVLFLVAISLLALYPPEDQLKGGIDLVGGTSMIFEIDKTGMQGDSDVAERMISILKARVDPNGQLNLVWRPIGSNRIEIQMPRPPKEAQERRQKFEDAVNQIRERNITRQDLEIALNAKKDVRPAELDKLVKGVDGRKELLAEVAVAFDEYDRLRKTDDVDAEWEARQTFEAAMQKVLNTSLEPGRLIDVLEMQSKSKREEEIAKLENEYPTYKEEINSNAIRYDAWAAHKSTLEDPSDLKRQIRGAGVLEFRILASRSSRDNNMTDSSDPEFIESIQKYRDELKEQGPRLRTGTERYCWLPVKNIVEFANWDRNNINNEEEFRKYSQTSQQIYDTYLGDWYVLTYNDEDHTLLKGTGNYRWELSMARADFDSQSGYPCVLFGLDTRGAARFGTLTENNVKKQLAITLDGEAQSHATINERIAGSGRITGRFSNEEVNQLVRTLEAGSLPARLKETPLMEKSVGPLLGEQNRNQGLKAALYGLIAVSVFILVYYLFAGVVANVALWLNLLFVLAIMAALEATFTLPGIAGLILTVGMAVDANVLIFERIREERHRGVAFRKAVKIGYDKAFSTIVDANLTTLITCVILGYVGSEEVKGFAMTLGFGIATSMFTALFVTRLIFNTLAQNGMLKDLKMLKIIGVPNIPWLSLRTMFWPISMIALVAGFGYFAYVTATDKEALYDIEFLGGTSVTIEVKQDVKLTDDEVRKMVTSEEQGSAMSWMQQAAEDLRKAKCSVGADSGQFVIDAENLTTRQLEVLMRTTFEAHIARDGASGSGNQLVIDTKAIQETTADDKIEERLMTLDEFKAEVEKAADYVADSAKNKIISSRVQTVRLPGEGADEQAHAFDIVTVETNRGLVQEAIVAAFGDDLKIERPITFKHVTNPVTAPEGLFPISSGQIYLSDVLGKLDGIDTSNAQYGIQNYRFGMAMVFTDLEPAQTTTAIEDRLKGVRLLPEFEQYEWRECQVFGLEKADDAGDEDVFKTVAIVASDKHILYDAADPNPWLDGLARPELELAKTAFATEKTLQKVMQFEATIAKRTQAQATAAMILALAAIVAYVWIRFGTMQYGLAAIVALVHDVSITLGLISLMDVFGPNEFVIRIDLAMVAAILTIIGYSLNDTIVVFDRIRENRGKLSTVSESMINLSINQCMSRTLLTSVTTFLAVAIMFVLGGPGIRGFSFALLVGVVVGTYSSVAIAAPLLSRPRLLHTIVYVLIALGMMALVWELSAEAASQAIILGIAGVIIAVLLVIVLFIEARTDREPVPMN